MIGLVLAVLLIVVSIVSIGIVSKIVAIGGPAYSWEYAIPVLLLCAGVYLSIYWWRRLSGV